MPALTHTQSAMPYQWKPGACVARSGLFASRVDIVECLYDAVQQDYLVLRLIFLHAVSPVQHQQTSGWKMKKEKKNEHNKNNT